MRREQKGTLKKFQFLFSAFSSPQRPNLYAVQIRPLQLDPALGRDWLTGLGTPMPSMSLGVARGDSRRYNAARQERNVTMRLAAMTGVSESGIRLLWVAAAALAIVAAGGPSSRYAK